MYRLHDFIRELKDAVRAGDFMAAQETVRHAVGEAPFTADIASSGLLHSSPEVTILHAVVNSGFISPPHDHRTWAIIGVYHGQEDNTFYRLVGPSRKIEQAGEHNLTEGDVMMLGPQAIHRIANHGNEKLIALHVYGKNIFTIERSKWDLATGVEQPFELKLDLRGKIRD
jgi:predicted metal-dependent enzyme (double-stranded beta helix superfamily)